MKNTKNISNTASELTLTAEQLELAKQIIAEQENAKKLQNKETSEKAKELISEINALQDKINEFQALKAMKVNEYKELRGVKNCTAVLYNARKRATN